MAIKSEIAVLGCGSIGVAWGIVFATSGALVAMYDPDADRISAAAHEFASKLDDLWRYGLLLESPSLIVGRIRWTDHLPDAVRTACHVQECAPENATLKRTIFSQALLHSPLDAVIASSSSAICASEIARDLLGCERCLVVHPGNPPYLIRVVEVVPAGFTAAATIERCWTTLVAAGMSPILVRKEVDGFVFNRLQGAVLREAYCLVRDGVADVDEIDRIMTEGLGLRWSVVGPFETADLNVRGGIEAHAKRMGPSYARMGAERGQNDPWTDALVATVAMQRRSRLPLDRWDDRVMWRDRTLMALVRLRRAQSALGPTAKDPL